MLYFFDAAVAELTLLTQFLSWVGEESQTKRHNRGWRHVAWGWKLGMDLFRYGQITAPQVIIGHDSLVQVYGILVEHSSNGMHANFGFRRSQHYRQFSQVARRSTLR